MGHDLATSIATAAPVALSETAREFIGASMRPNTRRAYAAQLRRWQHHCEADRRPMFPADPASVANWLAARASAGQSASTLRTAVAALKAGAEAAGFPFDTSAPAIARTLRGASNAAPRLPRQAEPLRGADVLTIVCAMGDSAIDRRDAALIALGYAAGLRRSELVGLDLDELGSGTGRLRITARAVELEFAQSKTSAVEAESVTIPLAGNAGLIRVLSAWLDLARATSGEPVFRSIRKGGAVGGRLSPAAVAEIVKRRVADAGTDSDRFSGHSLRVGFAVSAAEAGADLRAIASVTRHRSLAMPARYAAKADQMRTSPHRLAGVGLPEKG